MKSVLYRRYNNVIIEIRSEFVENVSRKLYTILWYVSITVDV